MTLQPKPPNMDADVLIPTDALYLAQNPAAVAGARRTRCNPETLFTQSRRKADAALQTSTGTL
jgi:hypothetical protein